MNRYINKKALTGDIFEIYKGVIRKFSDVESEKNQEYLTSFFNNVLSM